MATFLMLASSLSASISYWKLYAWNETTKKMESKSDWLKETALKFPLQ